MQKDLQKKGKVKINKNVEPIKSGQTMRIFEGMLNFGILKTLPSIALYTCDSFDTVI